MRNWMCLLACSLGLYSCTAIVEQRRPGPGGKAARTVQAFRIAQLNIYGGGHSMCSDTRGDIFITDAGGWRMLSFKSDGSPSYESAISSPRGFLLNGQANGVYLADDLNKQIQYYDVWGQKQSVMPYSGNSFVSGAVLKDGSLYLLDNQINSVVVLDNQGKEVRRFRLMAGNSGWQRPTALAVDGTGTILATADAQAGKITVFNAYGSYLGSIAAVPSVSPSAVCFEPGTTVLWVCEKDKGRLSAFEIRGSGIYQAAVCVLDNPVSVTCSSLGGVFTATDKYLMNISEK